MKAVSERLLRERNGFGTAKAVVPARQGIGGLCPCDAVGSKAKRISMRGYPRSKAKRISMRGYPRSKAKRIGMRGYPRSKAKRIGGAHWALSP